MSDNCYVRLNDTLESAFTVKFHLLFHSDTFNYLEHYIIKSITIIPNKNMNHIQNYLRKYLFIKSKESQTLSEGHHYEAAQEV